MKSISFLLIILMLASTVWATPVDLAIFRSQSEQRLQDRLEKNLDPVLGHGNYTLSVQVDVDEKKVVTTSEKIYFPKLGLSIATPEPTDQPTNSEKWISLVTVKLACSTTIQELNLDDLKSQVTAILKSSVSANTNVEVTTFTPLRVNTRLKQIAALPWTPLAIVLCGIFMGLTVVWSTRKVDAILARSKMMESRSDTFVPEANTPLEVESQATGQHSTDGLQKWRQWLEEDIRSASSFIERLARSKTVEDSELLAYALQMIDLKWTKPLLQKFSPETILLIKEALAVDIPSGRLPQLDRTLANMTAQSFIEQQTDSENVLKWIGDLTLQESIEAGENDVSTLAVFIRFFSTPHMEQILDKISTKQYADFLEFNKNTQKLDSALIAKRIHDQVVEKREKMSAGNDRTVAKMLLIISHLDTERERSFYESNPEVVSHEQMKELVLKNFPRFLVSKLPEQILRPVLNSYALESRAELMATFPEDFRKNCLEIYRFETRMHDALEFEIEKWKQNGGSRQAPKLQADCYERFRKYIRSSPEISNLALAALEKWIQNRQGANDNVAA